MSKKIIVTAGLVFALTLALSAPSFGQSFGISFSKHGRHGGISIGANLFGGSHCAPRPHVHTHCCIQQTAGYWTTRCERVWVPGCAQRVWVPPVYRTVCTPCGGTRQILVRAGFYRTVPGQGYYRTVNRRVWVPGSRRYVCGY